MVSKRVIHQACPKSVPKQSSSTRGSAMVPHRKPGERLRLPASHSGAHHGAHVFAAVWQWHIIADRLVTRPAKQLYRVWHPHARIKTARLEDAIKFLQN